MIPARLLRALGDGGEASAGDLAARLGWSVEAVENALGLIPDADLERLAGGVLRLRRPIEWLDPARIRRAAGDVPLGMLEVRDEVDSTNARLLAAAPPAPGTLDACLAEQQTAGRGRHGRRWVAPLAGGVYLSTAWSFAAPPRQLPALTLAVGAITAETLEALGVPAVALKWPNDLVADGRKLGGILVELRRDGAACHVVIGVGVNCRLDETARAAILPGWGRGPVDLATLCGSRAPSRNELAGRLIAATARLLAAYDTEGFAAMHARWSRYDWLRGRTVTATPGRRALAGVAVGVDADGALGIETARGVEWLASGEVSVSV